MQKVKTQQKCFNFLEDFKLSVSQQLTVFNFYLLFKTKGGEGGGVKGVLNNVKDKVGHPLFSKSNNTSDTTDTSDTSNTRNARNICKTGTYK